MLFKRKRKKRTEGRKEGGKGEERREGERSNAESRREGQTCVSHTFQALKGALSGDRKTAVRDRHSQSLSSSTSETKTKPG